MIKYLILLIFLLYLSYTDYYYRRIPNKVIALLLTIGFCFLPFSQPLSLYFLGLFLPSLILFLMNILYGNFIGFGDIKLFICTGLFLGFKINILLFILTCVCALLFCAIYSLLSSKKFYSLPLAPFICCSIFLVFLNNIKFF